MNSLARRLIDRMPSGPAQLAYRIHEVVRPQPWATDIAAVELYRAEKAHRRGLFPYPSYLYGLVTAARTARAIGGTAFTAVEFGVAGGNGLCAMEDYAERVGRTYGVRITVVGLDSGAGLIDPADVRDCGFALGKGDFAMNDPIGLRARLRNAELIIGPVEDTVGPFMNRIAEGELPPLGFVSHDLDVFTGTLASLDAVPADPQRMLPRVAMYFDDLTGYPFTDRTGERAAITAYNEKQPVRRIGQIENLCNALGGSARWQNWPNQVFVLHVFDHPDYDRPEEIAVPDLGLR